MNRQFRLFDERLVQDEGALTERGEGRHLLREYEGASFFAVVEGGAIVRYEAEREGKPIETTALRLDPDGDVGPMRPPTCYHCMCWPEGCACWEIDC